jgi:putative Mn2+ efflux pump MntP
MASFCGGFKCSHALIGWTIGLTLQDLISFIDHWIAFGLLMFIGTKMIYDFTKKGETKNYSLKLITIIILAIATSVDALMVGLSLALLQTNIFLLTITIGVVTFLLSLVGFVFGHRLGQVFENRIKIVGGIILISIGLKILLDHIFA